jgi:putative transposase
MASLPSSTKVVIPHKRMVSEYVVDETLIKVGSESIWLWVAIEPENRQILALF